jgi:hypothetical protein
VVLRVVLVVRLLLLVCASSNSGGAGAEFLSRARFRNLGPSLARIRICIPE